MDHLPKTHTSMDELEVPYVVVDEIHSYNRESTTFQTFGNVLGLKKKCCRNRTEILRIIQEWLFFGVLSEILKKNFQKPAFLKENSAGKCILTTAILPDLLRQYHQQWLKMSSETRMKEHYAAIICLKEATEFINQFLGPEYVKKNKFPLQPKIALSITIMVDTLAAAVSQVCGGVRFRISRSQLVDNTLLAQHWCPTGLAYLELGGFGPLSLYYMTLLGPLASARSHSNCKVSDGHCAANNVKTEDYRTLHVKGCKLEHSENAKAFFKDHDSERLVSIIESKKAYPLTLVLESSEKLKIELRPSDAEERYVAISHVWMDGLGSDKNVENALPHCQLRRLQILVNSMYAGSKSKSVPFWIDTLSIPNKPDDVRQMAIESMPTIYQKADKILILDANLYDCKEASSQAPYLEVLMRVMSTNWMRRLWTLAEGVSGRSLHFLFKDGIVDIQNVVEKLIRQNENSILNSAELEDPKLPIIYPSQYISMAAVQRFQEIRKLRHVDRQTGLATMWNNMQFRTTSHPRDETICMAIMLNFQAEQILELGKIWVEDLDDDEKNAERIKQRDGALTERYKVFWEQLRKQQMDIPTGLIFARGERFSEKHLRWAPRSFFRPADKGTIISPLPACQLTDKGLSIVAPGFELYLPPSKFNSRFVMLDEASQRFYDVDYATPAIGNTTEWSKLEPWSFDDPAIVLGVIPHDSTIRSVGLLVSISSREEDALFADVIGHVVVRPLPSEQMNWGGLATSRSPELASEMKAGLMSRLWNRRKGISGANGRAFVTPRDVLDQMPTKWHLEGETLNKELDSIFASSTAMAERKWCLS